MILIKNDANILEGFIKTQTSEFVMNVRGNKFLSLESTLQRCTRCNVIIPHKYEFNY